MERDDRRKPVITGRKRPQNKLGGKINIECH
jgi:hypothetical protein